MSAARIHTTDERRQDSEALRIVHELLLKQHHSIELLRMAVERLASELRVPRRKSRRENDCDILSRLLPAIAGEFGSTCFLTSEVLNKPVLKTLAGMGSRKLGCLLSRSLDVEIQGYLIERVDTEHSAALWRVVKVVC
jgi:hypothetical protein